MRHLLFVLLPLALSSCNLESTASDTGSAGLTGEGTQVTCQGDDCLCQDDAECAITCNDGATACASGCGTDSACTIDCNGAEECTTSCASAGACTVDCAGAVGCFVACPDEGCRVRNCELDVSCLVSCADGEAPDYDAADVVCGG